jgi:hypothetical protein
MDPTGEIRDAGPEPAQPAMTWEPQRAPSVSSFQNFNPHGVDPERRINPDTGDTDSRLGANTTATAIRQLADHWCGALSRPTFGQIHGRSPMETTRIVWASRGEAADALGRSMAIEWGRGRGAGQLHLGPFRSAPTELGQPLVADALLDGHRIRHLRVSVAVFQYGNERCGIQIRPEFRRPRSSRRLRRCLRSTHGAADRLRELVLAVDFMPPRNVATSVRPA